MPPKSTLAGPCVLLLAATFAGPSLHAEDLFTQLGDAVDTARLETSARLREGSVPVSADYAVTVEGTPSTRLEVVVRDRRLERVRFFAPDEGVVLVGRGLDPDVVLTRLEGDASGSVTSSDFHGRGFGRLVVGLFKSSVRKKVGQLRFHTGLSQLLRGDVLAAAASPPAPGASYLDLVDEVRVLDLRLSATPGQRLSFGDALHVATGGGGDRDPLEIHLDEARYQPGRAGGGARWSAAGRLDGPVGAGTLGLATGEVSFRSGELLGGRFSAGSGEGASSKNSLRVGSFRMELAPSALKLPGGIDVRVDEGSRLGISGLVLEPDGSYLGRLDFALRGGAGEIRHEGERLALSNARISSSGLLVRDGRATGSVTLELDYALVQPFVVKSPGGVLPPRTVPLEFRGPLSATLLFSDVGPGTGGSITGDYSFRVPWKPVEVALLAATKSRWTQALKNVGSVDFSLEPRAFGPCGPRCFAATFVVTAERKAGSPGIDRQRCAPEGKADLVVGPAGRSVVLGSFTVTPHCRRAPGWFASLVSPLVKGACDGTVLFQLPPELPFSIETVRTGNDFVRIDGSLAWRGPGPAPPKAD